MAFVNLSFPGFATQRKAQAGQQGEAALVFVAGHSSTANPHRLQKDIRQQAQEVLNTRNVRLVFDENVNVWNADASLHGRYDAVWLLELGASDVAGATKKVTLPLERKPLTDLLCKLLALLNVGGHLFVAAFPMGVGGTKRHETKYAIRRTLPDHYTADILCLEVPPLINNSEENLFFVHVKPR